MRRNTSLGMFASAAIVATALVGSENAWAGKFKTLNTADLAVNEQVRDLSRPQNTGGTMEMELYEFTTKSGAEGTYQCRIARNATTRPLNLRLIALNGTVLESCEAPANQTCSTTPRSLVSNAKFLCLVASFAGSTAGGFYEVAVRRTEPGALLSETETDRVTTDAAVDPDAQGVLD
jgi:hypothetical protein